MAYGFELEAALHDQLRGPLPPRAVEWVQQQTGRRIVGEQPLEGGQGAAMHRLTFGDGEDLVIRRFVLDWVKEEPWAAANEAMVFELLAATPVPAPRLVAVDPTGGAAGTPTILMSWLRGELVWRPADLDSWLDELVAMVVTIQRTPVVVTLRDWEAYPPEGVPPPGTQYLWAWERAIAAYYDDRPATDRVFLHRDFHPGNLLWEHGRISAVVDWASSCAGPPEEDIAHCRVNLARRHSQAVADEFLSRWLHATGRSEYHPYWDLLDVVSMGGGQPHPNLDSFVAAAASRL
jgi:aminoglycoside phosphotransferase (APT) family kinase protein